MVVKKHDCDLKNLIIHPVGRLEWAAIWTGSPAVFSGGVVHESIIEINSLVFRIFATK